MKLATTTSHLLTFAPTYRQALKYFAGTGFKHLDCSFYDIGEDSILMRSDYKDEVKKTKETADSLGLTFVQAHSPGTFIFDELDFYTDITKRSIEACGILGIPHIVVHSQQIAGLHFPEQKEYLFRQNELFFQKLYLVAEKNNVNILIENWPNKHGPDSVAIPGTATELLEYIDYLNHPLVAACWDTGHAHMNQLNQHNNIVELGSFLKGVHIQDNFVVSDVHITPLMGSCDFNAVIKGLIDIDFDGAFTFETGIFINKENVSAELMKKGVAFLYDIGKHMLAKHNCFDE